MKEQTREEPGILAAAERKMYAWAVGRELADHADQRTPHGPSAAHTVQFVAISREAGAGGGEIGRVLGKRLGWEVFGRNLLDCVAERFHLPRVMLDLVDETHANWVYDVLGTWMDRQIVPHEKFVACLTRVVSALARRGHAVFVGRGAMFLLPRQQLLAVRLIASPKYRIRQVMETRHVSEAEARQLIAEWDEGRRAFALHFFHHDVTDPHLYDLVINVERCGKAAAVDEIVKAVEASVLARTTQALAT